MFGWDWGAHLPDGCVFRPVKLLKVKHGRMDSMYIRQEHEEGTCTLHFTSAYICKEPENCQVIVKVTSPDEQVWETTLSKEGEGCITIENPQLWWVNGLGEQPLYQVKAMLFYDNQEVDTWRGESVFEP